MSLFEPGKKRRPPIAAGLVLLLLAGTVVFVFLRAGRFGVLLYLPLLFACLVGVSLLRGIARITAGAHAKPLRAFRALFIAGALLADGGVLFYGSLSILRFAGDQAALAGTDRYVAVIVLDGASLLQARRLLFEGLSDPSRYATEVSHSFPNISRYFLEGGAFTAYGISIWPSSSVPAHTGIVTGCYPRRNGILGQRQFERKKRLHTSFIGLGISSLGARTSAKVKTLNECFPDTRSVDLLQFANRGCSLYLPMPPDDELVTHRIEQVIRFTSFAGRLTGRSEVPRLLVATLPSIDHATHNHLLDDKRSVQLYLKADERVGRILEAYRRAGLYDKTLFVLCADHGMGEVRNHVTVDNLMRDMRFHTFHAYQWTLLKAWGQFESNLFVGSDQRFNKEYDALALWGGNSDAILYVKGQRRGSNGAVQQSWDLKPDAETLARYRIGGTDVNVVERLLAYSPGVGLALTNPEPNVYDVASLAGKGRIRERLLEGEIQFQYTVTAGKDPLGYTANPAVRPHVEAGDWLPDGRWLQLTYQEHYPDAIRRIAGTFGNPSSGDLHVVAADGWDFTPYYAADEVNVGSHGSLNQQQSTVPIMFHGPGIKRGELAYARTVDVLPTVLAYLGVPAKDVDGRPLPVFADEKANGRATAYFEVAGFDYGDARYSLEAPYGSYDRRIVRKERADGRREVLLAGARAVFPVLQKETNATLEPVALRYPSLVLRVAYAGEQRKGPTVRFNVVTREVRE